VFPSFNVADSAISVGAVLLVLFGLFASGKRAGAELK
jgi:lipoprotein signal peptidase